MKLPKSILSAMAVGIALSATSCSLGDVVEIHDVTCAEDCEIVHSKERSSGEEINDQLFSCPGCGMG